MQNGDISNTMPQRMLVALEVIQDTYRDTHKILGIIPTVKTRVEYNRLVLSHLYMISLKRGITLELIGFGKSDADMNEVMIYLDKYGTNPFRYASSYKSVDKLVAELPYRPEILGVVDIQERFLRYGRWGLDFPSL